MADGVDDPLGYGRRAVSDPAATVKGRGDDAVDAGAAALANSAKILQQDDIDIDDPVIEEFCVGPGSMALPLPARARNHYSSVLGAFAERRIEEDFCDLEGCQPYTDLDSLRHDFFDYLTKLGDLIGYYRKFNAHLTDETEKVMRKAAKRREKFRRPDIIRHTDDTQQYIEIKPDSASGKKSGRKKLRDLDKTYTRFQLPYQRGTFYHPSDEILIATVRIEGSEIELFMKADQFEPALLTYRFCMRGELTRVSKRLSKKARQLALLGLLIGAIIPIRDPVERPIEQPVDDIVPMPIPAEAPGNYVVPVPYTGPIEGEFTFNYVRGLSRTSEIGVVYPIVISYRSGGETYRSVVNFRLSRVKENRSYLISANKQTLNIAASGNEPHLILRRTPMVVSWRT